MFVERRGGRVVLSIGKLGRGQESYYLGAVAKGVEDYYTGDGEAPGEWVGTGAARLGLSGQVADEDLRTVLAGFDPASGDRLGQSTRRDRVPGWDLTFSAPKSASVLYALGGPEVAGEVTASHRAAVAAGLEYLERHATVTRRRTDDYTTILRTEGLVAAAFPHRTSRAGDPQLHTHVLVANAVERIDGGWGAIHSPLIYQHARTAGFVYQAVLRGELTARLGVEWGEVTNGYADVDGVDRELVELFSKRSAEIRAVMAERGEDSPRAAATATLASRHAKDYGVDPDTLGARWRDEAATLDPPVADVSGAMGRPSPAFDPALLGTITDELTSPEGLTAETASFDRRDLIRAWCAALPPGVALDLETIEELVDGFVENDRVVPILHGTPAHAAFTVRRPDGTETSPLLTERRWSTTEMLGVEARLLERASRSRRIGVGVVDPDTVTELAVDAGLSDEQTAMVAALTSTGNGIDVVVGRAGTGKTYALAAATRAWRAGGWRPVGVAVAARAAAELETGAGLPSSTLARLLQECDTNAGPTLDSRSIVVLDEAGMVDTRQLDRLAAHVDAAGAKLVLVGDHHQLPPVGAGGAFAGLVNRLDRIELRENRRQVAEWERDLLDRLRTIDRPRSQEIVDRYGAQGRLHIAPTPRDARAAMVADWYQARCDGHQPVMLALRRADVDALNTAARALLLADGTVASDGITAGGWDFAVGDRVVCLRNDYRLGVHNALFATVDTVDHQRFVLVTEDEERRVEVPVGYAGDGHLDHAYATTIHKAQGATYTHALLLGDDYLYRQAGYTALSRGKISNDLYLVDLDDYDLRVEPHGDPTTDGTPLRLARTLGRDSAKHLATDEAEPRPAGPLAALAELWAQRDQLAPLESAGDPANGDDGSDEAVAVLDAALERRAALAGRAAEIDRPDHIVDLLGHPPADLDGRERWREAAGAIETYAARWATDIADTASIDTIEQANHHREAMIAVLDFVRLEEGDLDTGLALG